MRVRLVVVMAMVVGLLSGVATTAYAGHAVVHCSGGYLRPVANGPLADSYGKADIDGSGVADDLFLYSDGSSSVLHWTLDNGSTGGMFVNDEFGIQGSRDLDGDGTDEIFLRGPAGASTNFLHVYAFMNWCGFAQMTIDGSGTAAFLMFGSVTHLDGVYCRAPFIADFGLTTYMQAIDGANPDLWHSTQTQFEAVVDRSIALADLQQAYTRTDVYDFTDNYEGNIIQWRSGFRCPKPPTCKGLTATIVGTLAPDVIVGTPGDDVIVGKNGDDGIFSFAGNDTACGGKGNDIMFAGSGNDQFFGGPNRDSIHGQGGVDFLAGQNGKDRLRGGGGNDTLNGGAQKDFLFGGGGVDILNGGGGNNVCRQDNGDPPVPC